MEGAESTRVVFIEKEGTLDYRVGFKSYGKELITIVIRQGDKLERDKMALEIKTKNVSRMVRSAHLSLRYQRHRSLNRWI